MSAPELPAWLDRRLSPRQRALLQRLRPFLMPAGFVGGFALDAATLRRVDDLGDNLQLTAFLLGSAVLLVLERRAWHGRAVPALVRRHRDLLRLALQVLFGGLFSAYFIFYSHSATLGPSLLFMALLAGLMLANELLFERLRPDLPQVGLWFFCALSYLLFAVPTWTGQLAPWTRLVAALLALIGTTAVVAATHLGPVVDPDPPRGPQWGPSPGLGPALRQAGLLCLAMLTGLSVLVWVGAVPPVPMALAHAGIFHAVERTEQGFRLEYEDPGLGAFWRRDDRVFRWQEGDRVHCFTAVFAPTASQVVIEHAWERKTDQGWVETDRIPWAMRGGRDGGWRSWTAKRNVQPGQWRVRVLTEHGVELGRLRFEVVPQQGPLALQSRVY